MMLAGVGEARTASSALQMKGVAGWEVHSARSGRQRGMPQVCHLNLARVDCESCRTEQDASIPACVCAFLLRGFINAS